ncbi:hypothetical protein Bca52824_058128 [Brassica carinata]|uniref:Uncharacterized protein n=1 Tax=Brassica carinata TaxID=52824 RepID=A0A8X7QS94_BRACI|nr:hypothetical protein Bca52824_058128 [Brassica carinata]
MSGAAVPYPKISKVANRFKLPVTFMWEKKYLSAPSLVSRTGLIPVASSLLSGGQ